MNVIKEQPKPVLLYELNCDNLAPIIAAAYFAFKKNLPTQVGFSYVLQKRPDISPEPWAFLQL